MFVQFKESVNLPKDIFNMWKFNQVMLSYDSITLIDYSDTQYSEPLKIRFKDSDAASEQYEKLKKLNWLE